MSELLPLFRVSALGPLERVPLKTHFYHLAFTVDNMIFLSFGCDDVGNDA